MEVESSEEDDQSSTAVLFDLHHTCRERTIAATPDPCLGTQFARSEVLMSWAVDPRRHAKNFRSDLRRRRRASLPRHACRHAPQPFQREPRITLQKLPRWKCGSLSASTSALTLPNVVSGLCLMLSQNAWMMSSLNCADARAPPPHVPRHCIRHRPAPARPSRRRPSPERRRGAYTAGCPASCVERSPILLRSKAARVDSQDLALPVGE